MPRHARRVRGWILRLVLRRWPALIVGVLLLLPAVVMKWTEARWERPIEAMVWVSGATGIAFVLAGLSGRQGDWIEEGEDD